MIGTILKELHQLVKDRQENRAIGSYTNYLLDKGDDKICQKIGEESVEFLLAVKNNTREDIIHEAADVLYHMTVALAVHDITWDEISEELIKRRENDKEEMY